MAKLETPAAVPAALRPPRPAVRMRADVAAAESEASRGVGAGDAFQREAFPGSIFPGDASPDVVEVLELDDDEVIAEPAEGEAAFESAEQSCEEAVTERGFDASTFGLPRAGGTKLPMANLEMPSASRLDLTPSPVPRVALSPATGAVDISLVPGPHASRNLPTLAAHHALGRRPVRRPASAITFPPPRRGLGESPRLGAGLAKDVRSSKREIVLGLAIGLGLSLVLAAVGQAYLHEEPVASSPPEVQSLALSARPESANAQDGDARDGDARDGDAQDGSEAAPSTSAHAPSQPVARATVPERAIARRAVAPRAVSRSGGAGAPERLASASRADLAAGGDPRDTASDRRAGESDFRNLPPRAVPRRSHTRRDGASPAPSPARATSPADGAGKGYDEPSTRAPLAPAAPLSPAESAGLGLDLPL